MNDLFKDNAIADVRYYKQPVTKSWQYHDHMVVDDGEHVLVMITSDDRAQDLRTRVAASLNLEKFDLVFIPISTANRNYIDFVNDHTITRRAAQDLFEESKNEKLDDIIERDAQQKDTSKEAAKAA